MTDCAAVNASPLIYLSKSGLLPLLEVSARELLVPRAVVEELGVKEAADGCLQRALALPNKARTAENSDNQ